MKDYPLTIKDYFKKQENQTFTNQYMCDFSLTDEDQLLYELAIEYESRCETFDSMFCTGKSRFDDRAIPINPLELKAASRNANEVMQDILSRHPEFKRSDIARMLNRIR